MIQVECDGYDGNRQTIWLNQAFVRSMGGSGDSWWVSMAGGSGSTYYGLSGKTAEYIRDVVNGKVKP